MASVKVAVRVRPFNKREIELNSRLVVQMNGSQVTLSTPNVKDALPTISGDRAKNHKFTFDYAHWSHDKKDAHFTNQARVFDELGVDVVENAFSGYNACVFAYGQTGSGKTYTMMGDISESEENGLIPRICQMLFRKMNEDKDETTTFRTEASYLEIYNEKVRDLLQTGSEHKLKVREHPKDGPYVQNLSKHLVVDYSEILELMDKGNSVRTTASTNMNDTSSRSHAIFTITFIKAGFLDGLPFETVSKIHLVDLAGSERANATGATGQRLKEGGHINKSLVTLGSVISALAEASAANHVSASPATPSGLKPVFIPYRDSVLTWLLKDSLGGNSKTIMIATISPAEINHGETLSTLRYANRAKNIINKPTVNEDPNVKLIRELREEIDKLRSMVSQNDPVTQRKLAVKEAQERHLTEEWTEKWREAANILKEQQALALKRTGQGVMLDSEKPHLVGIDEDVLSTGITLYHLKEGITTIGSDEEGVDGPDITLRGPCIIRDHCIIELKDGCATLTPRHGAVCSVNAVVVTEPTRLSQGCVVVLGKTNMFRYNDPTEAASMRLSMSMTSSREGFANQSLLSQSLSDLRNPSNSRLNSRFNSSLFDLDIQETEHESSPRNAISEEMVTSSSSKNSADTEDNNNKAVNPNLIPRRLDFCSSPKNYLTNRFLSPDSGLTAAAEDDIGSTLSSCSSDEMSKLYEQICEQKEVIMKCLDSEHCDLVGLNEQISVLQAMQTKYSRLEYDLARNVWLQNRRNGGSDADLDYEATFTSLVEQEVDRRLFRERLLRAEAEFKAREMMRREQEREVARLQRNHEREIYILKRKLHEAATIQRNSPIALDQGCCIVITVPSFSMIGFGSNSHIEYTIKVVCDDETWTIMRRFRKLRELHMNLSQSYGAVIQSIPFPQRRIFGSNTGQVALERQHKLQIYLNMMLQACSRIPTSPVYRSSTKESLISLSTFFQPDSSSLSCQPMGIENHI